MVSIVTDSSQCETVIKKILRIGWYGLSAELKYIDPWAHVGSKRSKSETQIEQPQSLEDNTSTPIQIDTRARFSSAHNTIVGYMRITIQL